MGSAISAEAVARAIGNASLLLIIDSCSMSSVPRRNLPKRSSVLSSRLGAGDKPRVLRIDGEQVYRVPAVFQKTDRRIGTSFALRSSGAFMVRTRSRFGLFTGDRRYSIDRGDLWQLDGIRGEFAAARAATLGFRREAAGLSDRFRLLTRGRHRIASASSARAALDWS